MTPLNARYDEEEGLIKTAFSRDVQKEVRGVIRKLQSEVYRCSHRANAGDLHTAGSQSTTPMKYITSNKVIVQKHVGLHAKSNKTATTLQK